MDLQTVVKIDPPSFRIDYTTRMMLLGSCFVENIGTKLEYFKFRTDINPCGIVYNPLSVATTLDLLLSDKQFTESDLCPNNDKWVSLNHHGSFSDPQPEAALQKINSRLNTARTHLQTTDVLIITWGTSWVYRYRKTGQIAANCHKLPAEDFDRFQLAPEQIVSVYTELLQRLWRLKPGMQVLFTVSPIRHWKDGAHGNQLSKAVLLLSIDHLMKLSGQISYFPSYEIVMDELRDYRFYAEDMLHISNQGVEYIWEKFRETYIPPETRTWMKKIDKLNKVLHHRPFDPDSEATRLLYSRTQQELEQLLQLIRS